jgi:hypothetical protein
MYAKLFASIYQGTLRGNTHGLVVFTNMLAHADPAGWVDIHPKAIAEEVGLTIDEVRAAIDVLEAPDIDSRSPEEGGRRLIRLDEHRVWGWRIVNHAKYRAIRSEEDRREQNRLAQERFRNKSKPDSKQNKPRKPRSAHTEAEAEALNTVPSVLVANGDAYSPPNCPFETILASYHELCPSMTKVRIMTNMRMKHTRARWLEVCVKDRAGHDEALSFFRWYFERAEDSDFLTGRKSNGDRVWKADFEWLMNQSNWVKVIEGKY